MLPDTSASVRHAGDTRGQEAGSSPAPEPRITGWAIEWDAGNQEDKYDQRPSEFQIRQTQRACPDESVRILRIVDGWKREVVEERDPLA